MTRLFILFLPLAGLLAQSPPPTAPRLELQPNALQSLEQPLYITIRDIASGEKVLLQLFQDCNHDGRIDFKASDGCANPVKEWSLEQTPGERTIDTTLALDRLNLKPGSAYWLVASRPDEAVRRIALFGIDADPPCGIFRTLLDTFFNGDCHGGLTQSLNGHLGPTGLEHVTFEIRRMDPFNPKAEARSLPHTRGATGLALYGKKQLLLTLAPTARAAEDSEEARIPPVLALLDPEQGKQRILWQPPAQDFRFPTAPLALPDGEIAFVRQAMGEHQAVLSFLVKEQWQPKQDVVLDYQIYRLLAYDATTRTLLAITEGEERAAPAFLLIHRDSGETLYCGYADSLYQTAMTSPDGKNLVVELEDTTGHYGRQLYLAQQKDHQLVATSLRPLQIRAEQDLLPLWSRTGKSLYFLAEVSRTEVNQ